MSYSCNARCGLRVSVSNELALFYCCLYFKEQYKGKTLLLNHQIFFKVFS